MTKNEVFKKTLEEIKANRTLSILESKNYLNSLYKDSEILSLSNNIGEKDIEIAKIELEGGQSQDLKEQQKIMKKQLVSLIMQKGYDVEKIIPKFNCKVCKDKGILDNGEKCACLDRLYYENLLKETMTNLSKFPTLENVSLERYMDKENKIKMISSLLNLGEKNTILFSGATGTGKTYLAKCFLKTYILKNNLGRIYTSTELNKIFVNAHTHYLEVDKILFDILDADILVIDDLGSEAMYKNITKEYLFTILNERQLKNKITLITTNLTLNDIKNIYNERFFSRLMDNELSLKYNFQGQDLRLN